MRPGGDAHGGKGGMMRAYMSDAGGRRGFDLHEQDDAQSLGTRVLAAMLEAERILADVEPPQDQRGQARSFRSLVFGNIDQRQAASSLSESLRAILPVLDELAQGS